MNPPFDVAAFARESESKLSAARVPSGAGLEAALLAPFGAAAAPEITETTMEDPVGEMRERFSAGDYAGALELAELLLTADPESLEAAECGEDCRTALEDLLTTRFGSLDRVPTVNVPRSELRCLPLDHRAGFVLSLVDDTSSLEMILDVCGMPKLDALRIIDRLVQDKIVTLR